MTQDIEPFDYQKTNNMDEHKQIVSKVNEIVDVINDTNLDGIPQLQSDVSTLKSDVANLESDVGQNTADISRVNGDVGTLKTSVADLKSKVTQNTTDIAGLDGDVDSLTTKVTNIESDITGLKAKDSEMTNDIDTAENAITTLNGKVIKSVSATIPAEGKLRTTITLEDNSTFATDDTILGLIATGGVQIISTSTARAFKLRFTLTDGTFWDTNDFVIPEGGGTDVTVTSVSIIAGNTPNSFKISIGLSDGEPITSNDYSFPTVPVASTATAGIVKVGSGLTIDGTGVLSATPTNIPIATTGTAGIVKVGNGLAITGDGTLSTTPSSVPIATTGTAGIVKIGANINVTADGTISVTFPSPPDLTPYLTKAEANTTYVTQTVANSTYATKTEVTSGLATKADNATVNAIGITTNENVATVNGKTANIINSISGNVIDGNLTIGVNGINSSPIAIPSGGISFTKEHFTSIKTFVDKVISLMDGGHFVAFSGYTYDNSSYQSYWIFGTTISAYTTTTPKGYIIPIHGFVKKDNSDIGVIGAIECSFYQFSYTNGATMKKSSFMDSHAANTDITVIYSSV